MELFASEQTPVRKGHLCLTANFSPCGNGEKIGKSLAASEISRNYRGADWDIESEEATNYLPCD